MPTCIFDAHCDTVSRLLENGEGILKNSGHIDIERIKGLNASYVQVFAAFTEKTENPWLKILKIIDKFYEFVDLFDELSFCKSYDDIISSVKNGKISALLSIEGGDALLGSLECLRNFYRLGVRILTLTWNHTNEIASGVTDENDTGLTDFGRKVIDECERLGVIVDVSHLSEKSFWDVSKAAKKPFIASHSNAKKLCSHPRNLTDAQIKEIIDKNGFIGLNFYSDFLSDGKKSEITDIIKHAEHILSLGGEDVLGFGSDFDGVERLPDNVFGVESYPVIINEFLKRGYSEKLVNKICSENFLRVVNEVL